jgi:2-keto-4-pentenoate hydratase/2-oxohepta-3-ene-1,7-dioic acid hydratase in catechol pathway
MKALKIIIVNSLFFFAFGTASAQTESMTAPKENTLPADTTMKEFVSMQAGQMIYVANNKTSKMSKDMTMSDGTVVKTNGTVITKDGKKIELHEGDRVYMNGKIDIQVKANVG